MTRTTAAPFAVGQRVIRRMDGKPGTVETVSPYAATVDGVSTSWAVAVRLDDDGEVWSGTETAWGVTRCAATSGTYRCGLDEHPARTEHAAVTGTTDGRFVIVHKWGANGGRFVRVDVLARMAGAAR